ncbi:MAG: penicillin-binding protein 2 [Alphaproteobacteria bacterium]|nr:penicillin-binding protein 2 [Alphaproteobacteria bacterium]MCW5742299.1 penicillin-binding protein 2 [Alphaproteobacteria bacterium]
MIARLWRRRPADDVETPPAEDQLSVPRRPAAAPRDALEVARSRLSVAGALFAVLFAAIALRMAHVSLLREAGEGGGPGTAVAGNTVRAERAEIVDRNGVVLATSLPVASLFVNPRQVIDVEEASRKIAGVLPEFKPDDIREKLESGKSWVWVKRALSPREQDAVNRLGLPGFEFQNQERRIFPQGAVAPHILGYTDIDNTGVAGIEKTFDQRLRLGEKLTLSIDMRLQRFVEQELARAMQRFSAIGATAAVMDVNTGEILALASLPAYDPNHHRTISSEALFNRSTLGVYEQGSTFKIFNTAMVLDSGRFTPASAFDAREPIKIDRFTINDYHGQRRVMSVSDVFKYSSNIGSAKMALEVGVEGQRAFFDKIGFLKAVPIELPEIGRPLYPRNWRKINLLTIAFGHGMSVTPLHVVSGTAAMINGGIYYPPTLLKRDEPRAAEAGVRVIKPGTSQHMRDLLRLVVSDGTGKSADVPGYEVGGKTGTAEKPGKSGYREKALISSFVGAFPMRSPRYVVMVSIDEPKGTKETGGYATGGWVAAPSVKAIIERITVLYGIPPVDPAAAARAMAAADAVAAREAATTTLPPATGKPVAARTAGTTIDQILGAAPKPGGR